MNDDRVLIIDDDAQAAAALRAAFQDAGLVAESVDETFAAMDKLRERSYCALVLDPTIHRGFNGYSVLNFLELDQPQTVDRLFLFTGMSEQTIRRTAPAVLPRLFRKPAGMTEVAMAVIEACGLRAGRRGGSTRRSVLVVEDDRATAQAMMDLIEELGFAAQCARHGREALEMLAATDFDAIVLDLILPQVDGFAVLDHVHARHPALLHRVIVITGMPDKYLQTLDRAALAGVMRKPLDLARLKELLVDCCSSS